MSSDSATFSTVKSENTARKQSAKPAARHAWLVGPNAADAMLLAPERSGGASYSETVKRSSVSVRLSVCLSGQNGQITQNMCVGHADSLFAVFEQSIFKVPKKVRLRGEGMICRNPRNIGICRKE